MKKQYLISLLGLAAISISLGNSFSSVLSSPSNSTGENSSTTSSNVDELNTIDESFNYSIEQTSLGNNHSAAVVNDGTTDGDQLYTWGSNNQGQLGLGGVSDWDNHNNPQEVDLPDGDIEQISMGSNYSAAIVEEDGNGSLYTWGNNEDGQLGLGDETIYTTPQKVDFGDAQDVEQISLGVNTSAAVVDNQLYTWGNNDYDQLGLGDSADKAYNTPQLVTLSPGDIEQLSVGDRTGGVVINESGNDSLYTWGYNAYGQLGYETWANEPEKVAALQGQDIEQISMGGNHSAAVVDDKLYTWGANQAGELGYETDENVNPTPNEVIFPDGEITQISMGKASQSQKGFSTAIVGDDLYTWGDNSKGQLGYGTTNDDPNFTSTKVTGLPTGEIKQVSGGQEYTAAIVNDGTSDQLYTWGENSQGKLGLGDDFTDVEYNTPNEVWETPYVNNENSSTKYDDEIAGTIQISYDFQSNVNVQDVTTEIIPADEQLQGQTLTSKPNSSAEDKYNGEETFAGLVPNVDYTYIISLNYSTLEGNKETVEIGQGDIGPYDATEPSIIIATNDGEVTVEGTNSASVSYEVTPGKNAYGHNVTVTNVKWIDNASGKELATSTLTDVKGTLEATELTPNTPYDNTVIVATMSDGSSTNEAKVKEFSTKPCPIVESTIIEDGKVQVISSTSASVNYKITAGTNEDGDSLTIIKVRWIDSEGNELAKNKDGNSTGTLLANNLKPNQTYDNTEIVATMSSGPEVTTGAMESFTAEPGNESSAVKVFPPHDITQTTADVNYDVTLGLDIWGEPVTTKKVEWINNDNDEVIATDNLANGIDGTLEATALTINTKYNDTSVIATMSDDTKTNIAPVDEFKTLEAEDEYSPSTITEAEVSDQTENSVTVSYEVSLGKEANGNPATITSAILYEDTEATKAFENQKDNGNRTITVDDLEIGASYPDATLQVVFSNEVNPQNEAINDFATDDAYIASTLDSAKVDSQDQSSVTVSYETTLGNDLNGDEATITSALLYEDAAATVEFENQEINDDGTITVGGLEANATYPDATLQVVFSNETEPQNKAVADFKTADAYSASTLDGAQVESQNQNSVTISYEVTLGHDLNGDEATITSATVYEDSNTTTKFVNQKDNGDGTITVSGLEANASYPDATLEIVFSNEDDSQAVAITDFKTEPADQESPTITATIDESKTTATSVTFDYVAVDGKDASGNDYKLQEIKIVDANDPDTILASEKAADGEELPLEGSITINDLEPNTTYDLEMIAVFVDTDGLSTEEDIKESIPLVTTTTDGAGIWTVLGSIVGAILLIAIFSAFLTYLSNKQKPNED